ncbi:MAG TPA: DoxX family protein [Pseudonocardia sp.]|nr:DoxX family protein [Pseudonocardia sp.]
MTTNTDSADRTDVPSRAAARTGLVLTVLVGLFLLFDSVTKLLRLPPVVAATVQLGFPAGQVAVIGGVLLVCLGLYLVPRTAVFGAVLLTGYLGGAVCTNMRAELPFWGYVLSPVYTGVLVWLALYLRSAPLRRLVRTGG